MKPLKIKTIKSVDWNDFPEKVKEACRVLFENYSSGEYIAWIIKEIQKESEDDPELYFDETVAAAKILDDYLLSQNIKKTIHISYWW